MYTKYTNLSILFAIYAFITFEASLSPQSLLAKENIDSQDQLQIENPVLSNNLSKVPIVDLNILDDFHTNIDSAYKILLKNGYVYIATRFGLYIVKEDGWLEEGQLDANTWNQMVAGYLPLMNCYDIQIKDHYAYITTYEFSLVVVDIADPSHPTIVAQLEEGNGFKLVVSEDKAYIAMGNLGLLVVSIKNPENPLVLSHLQDREFDIKNLGGLEDGALYFSGGYHDLGIIDVSDPYRPTLREEIDINGYATDLARVNDYIYLSTNNGLYIFSIDPSNPFNLRDLGSILDDKKLYKIAADETTIILYHLADDEESVVFMDNSDPTRPIEKGTYYIKKNDVELENSGSLYSLGVEGCFSYIGWLSGFDIIDHCGASSNQMSAKSQSNHNSESIFKEFPLRQVQEIPKYFLDVLPRWDISKFEPTFNVRLTEGLKFASYFDSIGSSGHSAIKEDYIYTAMGRDGLLVLQVKNDNMDYVATWQDSLDEHETIEDVAISGNYAFLAHGDGARLTVLDISQPENPQEISSIVTGTLGEGGGWANSLVIGGDLLYLACGGEGLRIMDIRDVTNPNIVGEIDIASLTATDGSIMESTKHISLEGDYAYVANWQDTNGAEIAVVDISSSTNPRLVNKISLAGYGTGWSYAKRIVVRDGIAFVASHEAGVNIIDLSNPLNPVFISNIDSDSYTEDITLLENNYLLIADGWEGMSLYNISDLKSPIKMYSSYDEGTYVDAAKTFSGYILENFNNGSLRLRSIDPILSIMDKISDPMIENFDRFHIKF